MDTYSIEYQQFSIYLKQQNALKSSHFYKFYYHEKNLLFNICIVLHQS